MCGTVRPGNFTVVNAIKSLVISHIMAELKASIPQTCSVSVIKTDHNDKRHKKSLKQFLIKP
jgi:hypothetical protein